MKQFLSFVLACTTMLSATLRAETGSGTSRKIGILIPLSGNYAELGSDNRQGAEAALTVLPDKPNVQLVYGDSKAEPATAMTEFKKLVSVDGVLGLFVMRSPIGMAINPISREMGVPILGGVGQKRFVPLNEYAWQVWSDSPEEGQFLAERFAKRGFRSVAIVTAQDEWTADVTDGLEKGLANKSIDAVNYEMLPTEMDFRSVISRIKRQAPDVTMVNLNIAQIGAFLRQARVQEVQGPLYSNFWCSKKQVIDAAGTENVEGVRYIEMDTNLPVFTKTIREMFQTVPTSATLTGYISTLLLMQAFKEKPDINSSKALYKTLMNIKSIQTPDGTISVKDRHVQFPLVERILIAGKATAAPPDSN